MNNSGWSLKSRGRSFKYAGRGVRKLFTQPNACIHASVMVIVIIAGWWYDISGMEWCIVVLCIAGVLMAESFNSAVETVADAVTEEYNPLIGRAKDLAAGAVLLFVIGAVISGLIIFLPHFFESFKELFS